jgi:hypothetical protein
MFTPRSLTSSSVFIIQKNVLPFKLKEIFLDCVFLPIAIAWNLSGHFYK